MGREGGGSEVGSSLAVAGVAEADVIDVESMQ